MIISSVPEMPWKAYQRNSSDGNSFGTETQGTERVDTSSADETVAESVVGLVDLVGKFL
jgi:hypothetical protein